jgi:hypothetical protein
MTNKETGERSETFGFSFLVGNLSLVRNIQYQAFLSVYRYGFAIRWFWINLLRCQGASTVEWRKIYFMVKFMSSFLRQKSVWWFSVIIVLMPFKQLHAQGTAFIYQGQLQNNGLMANGLYDFRFKLAVDSQGANDVGNPFLTNAIPVSNGLFNVDIDFGSGIFTGTNLWLEVDVRTNDPSNDQAYTTLTPLQVVAPSPYAILANTANNFAGTLSSLQVTGAISTAQLPTVVPTSVILATSSGLTGAASISGNTLNLSIIQTNLWSLTNGTTSSIINCTNPVSTLFANASFAFAQPTGVQPNGYCQPVIEVANSSGSVITITPASGWHSLPNSVWNCTNETMVTLFIRPGQVTNAACTPVF